MVSLTILTLSNRNDNDDAAVAAVVDGWQTRRLLLGAARNEIRRHCGDVVSNGDSTTKMKKTMLWRPILVR